MSLWSRLGARFFPARTDDEFRLPAGSHGGVVRTLLHRHSDPLHLRVRARMIDALADRIVALEPTPEPFLAASEPRRLAALVQRLEQVVLALEAEDQNEERRFANFRHLYYLSSDPVEQRAVLAAFIRESVSDPTRQRGDLAALDRFLGYDALRERSGRARQRLMISIELALDVLGSAAAAAIDQGGDERATIAADLLADAGLDVFLARRLEASERWQNRGAALHALAKLYTALERAGLVDLAAPAALRTALRYADVADEHPWVQARALELVPALAPEEARTFLAQRLLRPVPEGATSDFLVRRLAVDLIARRYAEKPEFAFFLRQLIAVGDPSEHVRQGLCQAVAGSSWADAARLLWPLAGLDPGRPESSHRVRAQAAIAAREIAARADVAGADERADEAADVLAEVLRTDRHFFVLEVACEESARLIETLGSAGRHALLERLAPRLLAALERLLTDDKTPPPALEHAAAAAEVIERELSPERAQATRALAQAVRTIPEGERAALTVPVPTDPLVLGRMLADLTRGDYGLDVTLGDRPKVARGDRLARHAWRVLHELKTPAPNKRQAWVHTTGRVYKGQVRAHPTLLDEVTATVVPGERVRVDSEGSWGRHLPLPDDLLHLPLAQAEPVHVASSHGLVTITPPSSRWQRLANRARITRHYGELAAARLASLRGSEPRERRRYLELVRDRYGITVTMTPWRGSLPSHVAALFPGEPDQAQRALTPAAPPPAGPAAALALVPFLDRASEWIDRHRGYFYSSEGNGQAALAVFAGGIVAAFMIEGYVKRERIRRARAKIPFTVGGWGTRGKSGTERLKAALFHTLGYEVFVKTTGCEAMFIHSVPGQAPLEIFIYRAYDKATIWEQRDMLELGAALDAEVFLWECMALNPKYVELLSRDWMRDDLVTLTNAFPDHEDIQGPAGINVAQVISNFIPHDRVLFTSEVEFLPLFQDAARARNTPLHVIRPRDGDLIADDVLDLFPYREHPRNIALVTKMAVHLGLEPTLAMAGMAENVVPDLGVLKVFTPTKVRGRTLIFMNGHSANERTGFINNWRRLKCDKVDVVNEPHRTILCVVNNRGDRVARSEVFARIMVQDAAVDRHVLIGTNLTGLVGYARTALAQFVTELEVVAADDLSASGGGDAQIPSLPFERLAQHMARLRIPPPKAEHVLARVAIWAPACGAALTDGPARAALDQHLRALIETAPEDGPLDPKLVRQGLEQDAELKTRFEAALEGGPPPPSPDPVPEVLEPPERSELWPHLVYLVARMVVHGRLATRLRGLLATGPGAAEKVPGYHEAFRKAYAALFEEVLIVIENVGETGDQIIQQCAKSVPPGTELSCMGTQNIKGTGLDWVYRWVAVDKVMSLLKKLDAPRADVRQAALLELEAFEDHGLCDTGQAKAFLARHAARPGLPADEQALVERVRKKIDAVYAVRKEGLVKQATKDRLSKLFDPIEAWVDYLDAVRRFRESRVIMKDLVDERISHGRAVVEMRDVYGRQKGGWLAKAVRRRLGRA